MSNNERTKMVAPCGIDCGICELYLCRNNQQLLEHLLGMGIPQEKLPCEGCRQVEGACPVLGEKCATYDCALEQKVEFCFECQEFPCGKLSPAADRANVLPHNTKVFNLCTIKRDGVTGFVEKSLEIKQKYYQGKMEVGKGPQLK